MITSIVVTGTHSIGMNLNKKIKVGDNVLSVEKEIPFVRYRFNSYGDNEFNYIQRMMQQFNCSTHLAEVTLTSESASIIDRLNTDIGSIAKYIYIDVDNTDVTNGYLSEEKMQLLDTVKDKNIDRIMLKDKSTSLDMVAYNKFVKQCKDRFGLNKELFGICSSPLSFDGLACLTSVKARELMTIYSPIADVALPTANHQCMSCCGCIRYLVVDTDLSAPADAKAKTHKASNGEKKNTEKTSKPSRNMATMAAFSSRL